jgi:uncharacterized protein (TIGR03790 family)
MRGPALFLGFLVLLTGTPVAGPERVLVVINEASEESLLLGELYARKRGVPERNLCRISLAPVPSLERRVYETEVRDAVAACLQSRNLQDDVLYIVTTGGVPLWIRGQGGPVGDLASVDSELALLYRHLVGERLSPFGRHENPYFAPDPRAVRPFRREEQSIYLVTRLTAGSPAEGTLLLDRGLVERSSGAFGLDLPSQSRSYLQGWIEATSRVLSSRGAAVELEDTASWLEASSPLLGYAAVLDATSDPASFPRNPWAPGAIALPLGDTWSCMVSEGGEERGVGSGERGGGSEERGVGREEGGLGNLVSGVRDPGSQWAARPEFGGSEVSRFRGEPSAPRQPPSPISHLPSPISYLLSPNSYLLTPGSEPGIQNPEPETRPPPCLPLTLISQGVTGTAFFVDDPTQDGYPRPQVLFPAYLDGLNLAESFYLATRYLGWRQVVVGDPLARIQPPPDGAPARRGGTDPVTGLPRLFAERRQAFLQRRHATSGEAIGLLLRAEGRLARGDEQGALADLAECLRRDSSIGEARLLQARLLERRGDAEAALDAFEEVLRLRAGDERELRRKLTELALHRLDDPGRAEPHARWLFSRAGVADPETTRLWAEVKLRKGELDQAEALFLRIVRDRSPAPGFALEGLGRVYEKKGDAGLAERFLRRALEAEDVDRAAVEARLEGLGVRSADTPAADGDGVAPGVEREAGAEAAPRVEGDEAPPDLRESAPPADDIASRTRPARVVHRIPPEYPTRAQLEGIQGRVVLRLLIDERGQLLRVEPVTGDRRLARAAERAVRQWTFAPKLVDGRPEVDSITVAIDFRLGND